MQFYFAPLEGIGGYLYRTAHADYFPKADKYFAPFISPNQNSGMNKKERRDVIPEHNRNLYLVPQILANNAGHFAMAAQELQQMGYTEVNLNLGCPSNTVVKKHKGAGFLKTPETLDPFLEQIFSTVDMKISIKTRIGISDPDEFEEIMEIYNRYPVHELIIHPRLQVEFYKGVPHLDVFARALEIAKMPIVYNGDLFHADAFTEIQGKLPQVNAVMAGRGVLANPCLFGEMRGEKQLTKTDLKAFHDRLLSDYTENLYGEKNILFKMKEHWYYMAHVFTNAEKYAKQIRKATRLADYHEAVRRLFAEQEIQRSTCYCSHSSQ